MKGQKNLTVKQPDYWIISEHHQWSLTPKLFRCSVILNRPKGQSNLADRVVYDSIWLNRYGVISIYQSDSSPKSNYMAHTFIAMTIAVLLNRVIWHHLQWEQLTIEKWDLTSQTPKNSFGSIGASFTGSSKVEFVFLKKQMKSVFEMRMYNLI